MIELTSTMPIECVASSEKLVKPNWWNQVPHPLLEPLLVIDNDAIKNHFKKSEQYLLLNNTRRALTSLHLKAVPFDIINCKDLPPEVLLVSSFDDWEKTAASGREYALHFGTPSLLRDQKDRLVTIPTLSEFKEKLEKIPNNPSKIIMDEYLEDIIDVLNQKNILPQVELEFKMNYKTILGGKELSKNNFHNAVHSIKDIWTWLKIRKDILKKYGEDVRVGINFYAGNPNSKQKLDYICTNTVGLSSLITSDHIHLLPSTISLGGFRDLTDSSILEPIKNINNWRGLLQHSTKLNIEHGSNMQGEEGFFAIFPERMSKIEIYKFLPDLHRYNLKTQLDFLKNGIKYFEFDNERIVRVDFPISYLEKQKHTKSIIINQ